MSIDGLDDATKNKIIGLLLVLFPDVKIYLYGSGARGTHRDRSDIDIALDAGENHPKLALGEAKSILEGTYIPYRIDLVDLNFVSEPFRETIKKDIVLWYPKKID